MRAAAAQPSVSALLRLTEQCLSNGGHLNLRILSLGSKRQTDGKAAVIVSTAGET